MVAYPERVDGARRRDEDAAGLDATRRCATSATSALLRRADPARRSASANWSNVIDREQAGNWARCWRQEVQWYIHAYQAVTGVDLSADMADVRQAEQARERAAPARVPSPAATRRAAAAQGPYGRRDPVRRSGRRGHSSRCERDRPGRERLDLRARRTCWTSPPRCTWASGIPAPRCAPWATADDRRSRRRSRSAVRGRRCRPRAGGAAARLRASDARALDAARCSGICSESSPVTAAWRSTSTREAYPIARWGVERVACARRPHTSAGRSPQHCGDGPPRSAGAPARRHRRLLPDCGRPAPLGAYRRSQAGSADGSSSTTRRRSASSGRRPVRPRPTERAAAARRAGMRVAGRDLVVAASLAKAFGAPLAVVAGPAEVVERFEARARRACTAAHRRPRSCARPSVRSRSMSGTATRSGSGSRGSCAASGEGSDGSDLRPPAGRSRSRRSPSTCTRSCSLGVSAPSRVRTA